jgi:putative NIF3 family GTP cyclohydrolase 1 type 2
MERGHFIKSTALTAVGMSLMSKSTAIESLFSQNPFDIRIGTAGELNAFLRSLVEVDEPSVDRIIIGDPETKIKKIGTCWLPGWNTLKQAALLGINVMVVHEPAFYTHWDLDDITNDFYRAPEHARKQYIELLKEKKMWILDNKMVIIRCHDVLDKIGKFGIPYALGAALGFSEEHLKSQTTYYNVYEMKPMKAIDAAHLIAQKLKSLNQPGVAFYGDENYMVSSVGVGTGCICDPMQFSNLNPDMYIAISDIVRTWIQTSFANDSGIPLVVIDHGTAEESGMRLLSELLQKQINSFETVHFQQGCTYKWIT